MACACSITAARCDMGDNHIINASKYSPSLVVAFRIAAAFGQPLDAVFQYQAEGVDPVL